MGNDVDLYLDLWYINLLKTPINTDKGTAMTRYTYHKVSIITTSEEIYNGSVLSTGRQKSRRYKFLYKFKKIELFN